MLHYASQYFLFMPILLLSFNNGLICSYTYMSNAFLEEMYLYNHFCMSDAFLEEVYLYDHIYIYISLHFGLSFPDCQFISLARVRVQTFFKLNVSRTE